VKHSSRFASFCLLAKGDYRSEIDLPFPFCLVDDDRTHDRLVLLPAYWWLYDLYALLRNETKFQSRDKRCRKETLIEYSPFAPDTAEEIIAALGLLERWTGPSVRDEAAAPGEVRAEGIENSGRPTVVKRPARSFRAYREMLLWYGASVVLDYAAESGIQAAERELHAALAARLGGIPRETRWENLGGQLVSQGSLEELLARVAKGEIPTWRDMHREYARLAGAYPLEKARHAWAVLAWLAATEGGALCGANTESAALDKGAFADLLERFALLSERVEEGVYLSRKKDYENKFRRATFRSDAEAEAVLGSPESNSFVLKTRKDLKALRDRAGEAIAHL
jgi:hypothetical protein